MCSDNWKWVVVGGQAHKVGKTSVIAGLIRGLKKFAWTAVKISYHGGEAVPDDARSADELPEPLDFLLSEESNPEGTGDTSLYLAAGARRALWLRAHGRGLSRAVPCLLDALAGDEQVIVESNSLLGFLIPAVFLMVIDESVGHVKPSARQFLARADAFVAVRRGPAPCVRTAPIMQVPQDRPVFSVATGDWSSRELCRFVSDRLTSTRSSNL